MLDNEKDVKVDPSTTEDEEEQGNLAGIPDQPAESDVETQTDEVTGVDEDVDERGVPKRNVYAEFDRKYSDLRQDLESFKTSLPEILEKSLGRFSANSDSSKQPKYTKEELIKFKNSTDDPEHKTWAEIELEKLRQHDIESANERFFREERIKQKLAMEQQSAQREVMRLYPEMFNPDGSWNTSNPMTERVARVFNSNPRFKEDGMGILAASKIAFADYIMESQPDIIKKQKSVKSKIKKLEKATMLEGGGVNNSGKSKNHIQVLKERFAETGRTEDLQALIKAQYLAKGE